MLAITITRAGREAAFEAFDEKMATVARTPNKQRRSHIIMRSDYAFARELDKPLGERQTDRAPLRAA
jgi:hypothetical protein